MDTPGPRVGENGGKESPIDNFSPASDPNPSPGTSGESNGTKGAIQKSNLPRQNSYPLSPQQPMSPDPVHDLPEELLQAGWRRFWSNREKRPYFFNKVTNESLWDMPGTAQVLIIYVLK